MSRRLEGVTSDLCKSFIGAAYAFGAMPPTVFGSPDTSWERNERNVLGQPDLVHSLLASTAFVHVLRPGSFLRAHCVFSGVPGSPTFHDNLFAIRVRAVLTCR